MACITPTHLYRRYLVDKLVLDKIDKPFKFLEIGCGSGEFAAHLAKHGNYGLALDISSEAIKLAKIKLKGSGVSAISSDFHKITDQYDYVFCFEVIEHLKDDKKAFKKIFSLVSVGGHFVFSVPAHMSLWGRDDEWGGHYRRYEKNTLSKSLRESGFRIINFWDYGFPIFNLTRRIYNFVCSIGSKHNSLSKEEATLRTGLEKEGGSFISFFSPLNFFLPVIFWFSNFFLKSNLGSGYLVECRK